MKRISQPHSSPGNPFTCPRLPSLRLSFGVLVGLVGVMVLGLPAIVLARVAGPRATIRVRVYNYTQASHNVLAKAEREASRIFGEAGLNVIWLDCSTGHSTATPRDPCQEEAPQATDISLRVLPAPSLNKFQDTVFGFAILPALAGVYYDHSLHLAMADNAQCELPIILGSVVAHEIGHLLLGSNSHSGIGIMQPQWERKQVRELMMGTLLFTSEQSKLMRAQARSRMGPQTATLNE